MPGAIDRASPSGGFGLQSDTSHALIAKIAIAKSSTCNGKSARKCSTRKSSSCCGEVNRSATLRSTGSRSSLRALRRHMGRGCVPQRVALRGLQLW
eukprot:2244337-Prymnesium_polylepis.1